MADTRLPFAGDRTKDTQQALNISLGYGLSPVYLAAGGSDSTNTFFAIQVITDTVLSAVTVADSTGSSNLAGITLAAGIVLYGSFTAITVTSGVICCYK